MRRGFALIGIAVLAVVIIGVATAFEPITRYTLGTEFVCLGCHENAEYDSAVAGSLSRRHPQSEEFAAANCADCHISPGPAGSFAVYTHILDGTDLFGWPHKRGPELSPAEVTPVAKKAHRVRDALLENDSATCRSCHIESEIKPKRKRGEKAHARALEEKQTCIACHFNVAHREVGERPEADDGG